MNENRQFRLAGGAAEIYEEMLVPLWFGRWADALLDLVELKPGENVLDVACGTGVTTRLAKHAVGGEGRVTGLDINGPMLELARGVAESTDIVWLESDVSETGLQSDIFDAVISQHGYHYFPDKRQALDELRRVLVPGGRLIFSIWDGHSAYTSALCSAAEKHISFEIAEKQRSQRETPGVAELRQILVDAKFRNVRVEKQTLEITVSPVREFVPLHLSSMPIAGAFHSLSNIERDNLIADVEHALTGIRAGLPSGQCR